MPADDVYDRVRLPMARGVHLDLKIRVDGVKLAMAQRRIDQLRGDLELLRAAGPADQYDASVAALRRLLAELPETGIEPNGR